MNRTLTTFLAAFAAAALFAATPAAALTLQPLSSFGGGDGWLSPAESSSLQGAHLQRGMSYSSLNNHVYVVDRNGGVNVRVLDGDTGALVSSLDTTGVTGGTFYLNMVDVADDGSIYAANLSTSPTSNFKVYRWANESSAPTVAYDAPSGLNRTGDTFAVRGSGASTQLVASGGGGVTDFARLQTVDGLNYTGGATGSTGGDFRLGLDFISDNTIIGKGSGTPIFDVGVGGGAANTNSVNSIGEAPLAYYTAGNLLATVDFNSSDVRLYDGSDLSVLTSTGFMDIATNVSGASVGNPNGTGDLKFGTGPAGDLRLYALNTNNGIQAFSLVVPEPASLALFGLAIAGGSIFARRLRG